MYLNKAVFSGRLIRSPEILDSSGKKLTQFNLRQEREYKSKGENYTEDIFILCEAWKSYAEDIVKNYVEGDMIRVEGYLRQHKGKDVLMVEKHNKIQ